MKTIIRHDVFDKFHNGFPRIKTPKQIVVHGTGGSSGAKALVDGWIMSPNFERAKEYKNGEGFPYLIDRDGTLWELADAAKWWQFHSGTSLPTQQLQDRHDAETIGIEMINPMADNAGPYSEAQYTTLAQLIIELLEKFPTIDEITGHGRIQKLYSGKGKNCPGDKFQWGALAATITAIGYQANVGKEVITGIVKIF